MAEIASLTIGGIGLASLFTTCVDCLDCITLAPQNNGYELPALREKWPQIGGAVGEALVSIKDAFTDVSALEKRYSLKATPESSSTAMDIHESRALNQIMDAFHIWAVHDKKKFDTLIQVVSFNIDRLEKISENLNVLEKQKKLASVIKEIDDEDSLKLLVEAIEENQSTGSASSGHLFINTIIGERARVTMGNAGNSTIVGYKFNRTNIMNAEVYIGNMLDAALASFYSALKGPELGKE
ncbi:hypothetical protein HYALB_00003596 [Hymenoscyphus albidus]|uniref:Prion-inhibition and propagation HeLo domain-containing protein n=1 Tax=Hymenoscyphus albidus TaxID=595503 RepID=A0A9N9M336_9HELO|nr:hypothetical protein HYALB_00003596 [Hymenoscyphus albidus]